MNKCAWNYVKEIVFNKNLRMKYYNYKGIYKIGYNIKDPTRFYYQISSQELEIQYKLHKQLTLI